MIPIVLLGAFLTAPPAQAQRTKPTGQEQRELDEPLDRIHEQLSELNQVLPQNGSEILSLARQAHDSAERSGLDVSVFSGPLEEVASEYYALVPFSFEARGTYSQVVHFVRELSRMEQVVHLHEIRLRNSDSNATEAPAELTLEAMVVTYRFLTDTERSAQSVGTSTERSVMENELNELNASIARGNQAAGLFEYLSTVMGDGTESHHPRDRVRLLEFDENQDQVNLMGWANQNVDIAHFVERLAVMDDSRPSGPCLDEVFLRSVESISVRETTLKQFEVNARLRSTCTDSDSLDPTQLVDPFEGQLQAVFQRYELSELELSEFVLTATLVDGEVPMGAVEDPTGMQHVVRIGTIIGPHGGRVSEIHRDHIIVVTELMDPSDGTSTLEETRIALGTGHPSP